MLLNSKPLNAPSHCPLPPYPISITPIPAQGLRQHGVVKMKA